MVPDFLLVVGPGMISPIISELASGHPHLEMYRAVLVRDQDWCNFYPDILYLRYVFKQVFDLFFLFAG